MSDLKHEAINAAVSANARRLRLAAGMTQTDVAQAIGVSLQQVHKYERTINRLSAGRLFALARAIGCKPEDFFAGLDPTQPFDDRHVELLENAAAMPDDVRAAFCALTRATAGMSTGGADA